MYIYTYTYIILYNIVPNIKYNHTTLVCYRVYDYRIESNINNSGHPTYDVEATGSKVCKNIQI